MQASDKQPQFGSIFLGATEKRKESGSLSVANTQRQEQVCLLLWAVLLVLLLQSQLESNVEAEKEPEMEEESWKKGTSLRATVSLLPPRPAATDRQNQIGHTHRALHAPVWPTFGAQSAQCAQFAARQGHWPAGCGRLFQSEAKDCLFPTFAPARSAADWHWLKTGAGSRLALAQD